MSTPTAVDGITLTSEACDAILWRVSSSSIGEDLDGAGSVDDYERLINLAQVNAILWRAALAGVLTPTLEVRDWLQRMRGSLLGVIRDDRNQLAQPRHEYPSKSDEEFRQGRVETELLLEGDISMLAVCEDLLASTVLAILKRLDTDDTR